MSYLFVWLYLLKCVFTCSIFVDSNTKRFLSVLGVFGKYFAFTKTEKFQKQCCPILATQSQVIQVACYSRELMSWIWRLVRKWKVQSRGVHRDFHGLARDSLAGRSSNRKKHFEFFFIILTLSVLAACPGDLLMTRFSHKKRVFCVSKTVFKTFSVFPSTFCDCSLSSPFLSQLKLTQTLLKLHFCIISSPIFKKKVWVFSVSLHLPCFECDFLDSVSVLLPLCFEKYHARSRVCFILVSVHWLRVSVFDFITGVYMKFVICALFHDSVVSFISCLWYSVTLFVIWILVMLNAHLILSYYCSSSYLIAYSTYYVYVAYDFLSLTWFLFLWLSEISLFHILILESNQTNVCTLWHCIWLFSVLLFSCRWLVVLLKAKTL